MITFTPWLVVIMSLIAGLAHLIMAFRHRPRGISVFFLIVAGTMFACSLVYTLAALHILQIPGQGAVYIRPLVILMTGLFLGYAILLWDIKP